MAGSRGIGGQNQDIGRVCIGGSRRESCGGIPCVEAFDFVGGGGRAVRSHCFVVCWPVLGGVDGGGRAAERCIGGSLRGSCEVNPYVEACLYGDQGGRERRGP